MQAGLRICYPHAIKSDILCALQDMKWASKSTGENLSSGIANIKGAYQPAHPRRLLSAFVIYCFGKCHIYSVHLVQAKFRSSTVLPVKSDSDVVFCLQLLHVSKTLTCAFHLS